MDTRIDQWTTAFAPGFNDVDADTDPEWLAAQIAEMQAEYARIGEPVDGDPHEIADALIEAATSRATLEV